MYDSFGDGWNGNTLTMTNSSGAMMVSQTLANGSAGTTSLCLQMTVIRLMLEVVHGVSRFLGR